MDAEPIDRRVFLKSTVRAAGLVTVGRPMLAVVKGAVGSAAEPLGAVWRNKQPTMGYRRLGRTGFMSSRIAFGAGGLFQTGGSTRVLEMAIERGLNYLDTGRAYRQSEATLAPLLKQHRDKLWLCSKAGDIGWPTMKVKPGQDALAARMYAEQLDESLRQMRVDHIDCYMVQGVEHTWVVSMDSIFEAFEKARKAGKVGAFGLATHTNVREVGAAAIETGRCDVIMLAVNPASFHAELKDTIRSLRDAGVGIVSMKETGTFGKAPGQAAYDHLYGETFAGQTLSAHQRAYAYMLHVAGVDVCNIHMPNHKIMEEDLALPMLQLGRAEAGRLEQRVLAEVGGACRHCGRCTHACPNGVQVADMVRYHAYVHHYGDRAFARWQYGLAGGGRAHACTPCGRCADACPEPIDLPEIVQSVRRLLA